MHIVSSGMNTTSRPCVHTIYSFPLFLKLHSKRLVFFKNAVPLFSPPSKNYFRSFFIFGSFPSILLYGFALFLFFNIEWVPNELDLKILFLVDDINF